MAGRRWVGGAICVGLMTTACGAGDGSSNCDEVFFVGPEGDRLVPSYDVYAYDEHGAQTRRLTDDHASIDAAVSPDGEQMVVRSWRGSSFDAELGADTTSLYVSDIDGGGERRLTTGHDDTNPTWSPDGARIAFLRVGNPNPNVTKLVVLDVAHPSTTTVVATFSQITRGGIVWLDNQTVAWWRYRASGFPVLSRDASGTGPISVAVRDVHGYPVVWSPDRTKIAASTSAGRDQLVVRDLDSGRVTEVPDSDSLITYPLAWTKDDRLFFTRNIAGPAGHLKIAADGGLGPSSVVGTMEDASVVSANPACG